MSCGRTEPAELCGLRKQVTEAKEGPLELRNEKDRENMPGERRGGEVLLQREREREHL